jgi:hypothetical protein
MLITRAVCRRLRARTTPLVASSFCDLRTNNRVVTELRLKSDISSLLTEGAVTSMRKRQRAGERVAAIAKCISPKTLCAPTALKPRLVSVLAESAGRIRQNMLSCPAEYHLSQSALCESALNAAIKIASPVLLPSSPMVADSWACNHHAGIALDALRVIRTGDTLSWCRL